MNPLIKGIHHAGLKPSPAKYDAAVAFYTELLNMKLQDRKRLDDCTLYFLSDEENTCQIELTYNDETPKDGYVNRNSFGPIAFSCENLDEFTEKMNNLGYEYLYEPFDLTGKGTKIAFIKDPDGNEIELIEKVVW